MSDGVAGSDWTYETGIARDKRLGSASWMIRVEALRAAAQSVGAVWGGIAQAAIGTEDPTKHITDEKVRQSVLDAAKVFERYLETGE